MSEPIKSPRLSVKALIYGRGPRAGQVLVIHKRMDQDGDFFLFPGGGQNHGESAAEALLRECREELGAEVRLGRLRFVRDYIARHHSFAHLQPGFHAVDLFFEAELIGEADYGRATETDNRQIGLAWLSLAELPSLPVYPRRVAEILSQEFLQGRTSGPRPVFSGLHYLGDVN